MPRNFKAEADGTLWRLIDGAKKPSVWAPVEIGGKSVRVVGAKLNRGAER
jgi:hypothetical protein